MTLGFLFLKELGSQNRREPKEIIIEKLGFDAFQQSEYEKLIQWHRKEIRDLEQNNRATKTKLYEQLVKTTSENSKKDSLIAVLSSNQIKIENIHFTHFQDIKKICHQDQLPAFESLTEELAQIFSKQNPKRNE